jgi:hypothetical protein
MEDIPSKRSVPAFNTEKNTYTLKMEAARFYEILVNIQ